MIFWRSGKIQQRSHLLPGRSIHWRYGQNTGYASKNFNRVILCVGIAHLISSDFGLYAYHSLTRTIQNLF